MAGAGASGSWRVIELKREKSELDRWDFKPLIPEIGYAVAVRGLAPQAERPYEFLTATFPLGISTLSISSDMVNSGRQSGALPSRMRKAAQSLR